MEPNTVFYPPEKNKNMKILWLGSLALAILLVYQLTPTVAQRPEIYEPTRDYCTLKVVDCGETDIAVVSAYSSLDSCHYENCVMASGKRAYIGAAACPRNLKLGTKIVILGKTYTCEDRTALRYDGRYDLFLGYGKEAHIQALKWGIPTLEVTIK